MKSSRVSAALAYSHSSRECQRDQRRDMRSDMPKCEQTKEDDDGNRCDESGGANAAQRRVSL